MKTTSDLIFKEFGCKDLAKSVLRTITYTPDHLVKQRSDGMHRYSFNTAQLINRSDWCMVTTKSLHNHGLTFSIGERSGKRTGQGDSRRFSALKKARIIPPICSRALSC
ncbi:hypothetical protein TNCV_2581171 [Trichonephila clavipes]|nr:hypothetical protein TNCV_2581171 [Trichonephila clavipes]